MGIDLVGALSIVENYGEQLEWFLPAYIEIHRKNKVVEQLSQADILTVTKGVGNKKGNQMFQRWRKKLLDTIEDDANTVFGKLQRANEKPSNTIFHRLQFFAGQEKR